MRHRLRPALPLLLLAALTMAACETKNPIETEEPEKKVLDFSGTLTVNGAATHRFTSQGSGEINVILKTLTSATGIGLGLGVWTGASCNIVIADENALPNSTLIGIATASGEFCARVADIGLLTGPADYAIEVTHF